MFILMLYAFAAVMSLARNVYRKKWPMVWLFFVATILLITTEQQNAALVISFVIISLGLLFLPGFKARKMAIIFGAMLICVSGVAIYNSVNQETRNANNFESFSHGVLMENSDPTKDIEKGGIDGQFALARNENYYTGTYTAIKPSSKYVERHLLKKNSIGWVAKYYATHFKQFNNLLDLAATDITNLQPKNVGDYSKESGHKPRSQVKYFTLYSAMLGTFYPGKYAFDCLLAVCAIGTYSVALYLDLKQHSYYGILRFFLVLGLMLILMFVPIYAIVTAGEANLAQRLFVVTTSLNLTILLFMTDVINHTLWHAGAKVGEDGEE